MNQVYGYSDLGELLAAVYEEWFFGVRLVSAMGYSETVSVGMGIERRKHLMLVACADRNDDTHYWRCQVLEQDLINGRPASEDDEKRGTWAEQSFVALKRYLDLGKVPFRVALMGLPKDKTLMTANRPPWLKFNKEQGFYLDSSYEEDRPAEVQP